MLATSLLKGSRTRMKSAMPWAARLRRRIGTQRPRTPVDEIALARVRQREALEPRRGGSGRSRVRAGGYRPPCLLRRRLLPVAINYYKRSMKKLFSCLMIDFGLAHASVCCVCCFVFLGGRACVWARESADARRDPVAITYDARASSAGLPRRQLSRHASPLNRQSKRYYRPIEIALARSEVDESWRPSSGRHRLRLQAPRRDEFDAIMEAHTTAQPPAYWAQVWPSAVAMARRLCDEMNVTSGATVLELGCGLGVASIAAALAGAKSVVATDVEQHALTYAAANADLNCVAREVFRTATFDWRDVSPPLPGASSVDVVLLADCVYDEEAPQLLSRVLHATVSLGGKVMLTDNADRPYESRRRDALVESLCGGPSADFELDRQFTTEVCLKTRQGERFQISHVDLIRVAIGE